MPDERPALQQCRKPEFVICGHRVVGDFIHMEPSELIACNKTHHYWHLNKHDGCQYSCLLFQRWVKEDFTFRGLHSFILGKVA